LAFLFIYTKDSTHHAELYFHAAEATMPMHDMRIVRPNMKTRAHPLGHSPHVRHATK
jgi:hypothetical protein